MITITLTMLIMMKMMTLVICHHNDEDFACSCGEAFYLKPIHLKQSKLEVNIRVVLIFFSLPQVSTKKSTNIYFQKQILPQVSTQPLLSPAGSTWISIVVGNLVINIVNIITINITIINFIFIISSTCRLCIL